MIVGIGQAPPHPHRLEEGLFFTRNIYNTYVYNTVVVYTDQKNAATLAYLSDDANI